MTDTPGTDDEITREAARVRGLKQRLEAQVPPRAVSLDGHAFTLIAPVSMVLPAGGYLTLHTPSGPALGQIREVRLEQAEGPEIPIEIGGLEGVPAGWVPFVQVDDVDVATKRAAKLGATVVKSRTRGPAGEFAIVRDPGGAAFALWQKA